VSVGRPHKADVQHPVSFWSSTKFPSRVRGDLLPRGESAAPTWERPHMILRVWRGVVFLFFTRRCFRHPLSRAYVNAFCSHQSILHIFFASAEAIPGQRRNRPSQDCAPNHLSRLRTGSSSTLLAACRSARHVSIPPNRCLGRSVSTRTFTRRRSPICKYPRSTSPENSLVADLHALIVREQGQKDGVHEEVVTASGFSARKSPPNIDSILSALIHRSGSTAFKIL